MSYRIHRELYVDDDADAMVAVGHLGQRVCLIIRDRDDERAELTITAAQAEQVIFAIRRAIIYATAEAKAD
jgi:hypothetical protein